MNDFFRINRGLEIDEAVRVLYSVGPPGGTADTDSALIGSVCTDNTNGMLYTKRIVGAGTNKWATLVTSVSGSGGTTGLTLSGGPIINSGTLTLGGLLVSANGGTGNGFTKFSGPTTTEKTFTLPDSSATLLYSGGALGTPSSGTLTNCTFPTLNQSTTGTAAKATNLVGGNITTLLGAIPYQSNVDTTLLLSPNTTTTKKFLRETGDGTNGATPTWDTLVVSDLPVVDYTHGGTGLSILGSALQVLRTNATTTAVEWASLPTPIVYAPLTSAYITIGSDATLTNERSLLGTSNQITLTDNGANSTAVLSITPNPVLPGVGSVTIPVGTTIQQPAVGVGQIRYDSTTNKLMWSDTTNWAQIGSGSVTSVSGSGGTTGLTLTGGPITNLGTLTLGGTLIPANGGTGVANGSNNTITFTGNYTIGLTLSANTSVTLPTSGTLINSTDTAAKATILATARAINGVNFDGSAPITINAVDSTARIAATEKDASGGVPALTGFNLNLKNVAGTITSYVTNSNLVSRTYTLPDKDGTFAMISDLPVDSDTLQIVTNRGNTTTNNIQLNGSAIALAPTTTPKIWTSALEPAIINVNTAVPIDSFAIASYRSATYQIQITQGTKYQTSTLTIIHDGTNVYSTEYGIVETNSAAPIPATYSALISAGVLTINATITDAFVTNAALLIHQTINSV